jgi:hypothetical protein
MTTQQRYALHTLSDSRAAGFGDFFEHYSAFKHGGHNAAQRYASALAGLVISTMAERAADPIVLTSPPFAAIPSASHYLAERLAAELQISNSSGSPPAYIPTRKRAAGLRHDYSRLAPEDRAASQDDQASLLIDPPPGLRHHHIAVVNDLRVTGHQERVLSDYLIRTASPTRITWFYLGEVSTQLAHTSPDIENRLNLAMLTTADTYVSFLCESSWSPTARGVRRLLELPDPLIRQVLSSMAADKVVQLAGLAEAELLCSAHEIIALSQVESSRK